MKRGSCGRNKVRAFPFMLALITGWSATALAMDCDKDTLSKKSDSGDILIMMSGHVYEVLLGMRSTRRCGSLLKTC
jgi:hypothetical protein